MKKFFKNRVVINTIVLFVYTFTLELIVRLFADSKLGDISLIRIALSTFIISLLVSDIAHFLPKLGSRIFLIIYSLFIGIYTFAEFGLYNYLGFFMGIGNSEQGTKVTAYIKDFIQSLNPIHWCLLIPIVIVLLYYIIGDRLIFKNKRRNSTYNMLQKGYIEVVTVIIMVALMGLYYWTIKSEVMQNELQTESNYSLWIYPENSNLTVNNFGVLMYGFADIKSQILKTSVQDVDDFVPTIPNNNSEVITDKSRIIDDEAWLRLMDKTSNEDYKKLNSYFFSRSITPKNEYTGIFEGKNLIIILMESVNEISILNQEEFPTLYKMYHEGISFHNNFTPRNNCSTGNNEFTVLSSLFTINNTCTANTYASNKYFEGVFNIFNNAGYKTTSYHDYTEQYYRRNKIHTGLGSQKFYGVTALGMSYDPKYEEWPSDVDMFKNAQKYYMDEDHFMAYFATVSTHQTYNVPSTLGDKYADSFDSDKYSLTLRRYLSKMKTLDEAMAELLSELESKGKLEDTVIAMFGDHFPYGLTDSQINSYLSQNGANYKINRNSTTEKNVDRTPMIIYNAGMTPKEVYDYTSVIDLLPTLLNMFNMDYDPRLYLGHDIFDKEHASRVVFADGSWQSEDAFYYAPSSKMTYFNDHKIDNATLKSINSEISTRQKMSALAIKTNYFKYLGEGLEKYRSEIAKEKGETIQNNSESEE